MPTIRRIGAVLLAAMVVLMLAPIAWAMLGPSLAPRLSFALDRPAEMPDDAVATYDFKFGLRWQFCRGLSSGRAIFTERGLLLEHGAACGGPVPFTYEPQSSLERPGMRLGSDGDVTFSVPASGAAEFLGPCPHRPSNAYVQRVRALVMEAQQSPDLNSRMQPGLIAAEARLAQYTPTRLRHTGAASSVYFCSLEPS